ncbi:thiamine phosphate synthase [Granulosicoccaceae sp. 1_MG-2023]|nr:thiamine phosphate synthase [Granulosicoccaceae sp. 1_MG-2023]
MTTRPVVLSIGGSDPTGLAGLAVDVRTINALGAHPASVVSAVTAQNSETVSSLNPVPAATLAAQLDALDPARISAVKTGLLANAEQIQVVAAFLRRSGLPAVVDPVLASSSGYAFLDDSGLHALRKELLPLARVVTPNIPEAQQLSGSRSRNPQQLAGALQHHRQLSVIVKGGHADDAQSHVSDAYQGPDEAFLLSSARQQSPNTRGTGCLFASALAAALAHGERVQDAAVIAKMTLNQALRNGYSPGGQTPGAPAPAHWPDAIADLPALLKGAEAHRHEAAFASCGPTPLGLYPIVDRADWLRRLLPLGVSTIQLRCKDLSGQALDNEIARAVAIARRYRARLFINDHWQAAIRHGAYGVHLGQEDLDSAKTAAIADAGLRLGISTHCHAEVARAVALRPSYIACGPVFPTNTKIMPWQPLGLPGLRYWQALLQDYPVVAIAGIKPGNIAEVAASGVSGIAMITAITGAPDPQAVTAELIARIDAARAIKPH